MPEHCVLLEHRVLLVGHTPTPPLVEIKSLLSAGVLDPAIGGVALSDVAALDASAADVRDADGILLITPANFGYMSGALKHFFDTIFRDCEHETIGLPVGLVVRGESDGTGAVESVRRIIAALGWKQIADPVVIVGETSEDDRIVLHDLGATIAALLAAGMA